MNAARFCACAALVVLPVVLHGCQFDDCRQVPVTLPDGNVVTGAACPNGPQYTDYYDNMDALLYITDNQQCNAMVYPDGGLVASDAMDAQCNP